MRHRRECCLVFVAIAMCLVHLSAPTATSESPAPLISNPPAPRSASTHLTVGGSTSGFVDSGQSLGSATAFDVALADLDGDGDLDAYVATTSANQVWLNDGDGIYLAGQTMGSSYSKAVALGDLDDDGDLDAFVANWWYSGGKANRVWINQGGDQGGSEGTYVDSGQALGPSSYSWDVALGDVDDDGDLDAFVANSSYVPSSAANTLWLNDGNGVFTDSGQSLGGEPSASVALGDLDGDDDLDAFVANDGANQIWWNNGSGTFANSGQTLGAAESKGVVLGDLDEDGDLDAWVANDGANAVWLNNGSGTFNDSGQSLGSVDTEEVALADMDADGDLDALTGAYGAANVVWVNDSTGAFSAHQSFDSVSCRGVALGDMDGDGDPDAYVAIVGADTIWRNDGTLGYIDSGQSLGSRSSQAVATGDLDGDDDPDAFVVNALGQANRVWLNDGTGGYVDSGQALGTSDSYGVALGDLDDDDDLDAFIANDGANTVWLNDGASTFANSGQSLGNADSRAVALADLDDDDDLDAYVANNGVGNQVWLNDGAGTFSAYGAPLGSGLSRSVALGDLDGDDDPDAFVGNVGDNRVWLNDGSSAFADSGQSLGTSSSYGVALRDVDGDDDLDAWVANFDGQADRVWLNNGNGSYLGATPQALGNASSAAISLGDVDGDDDLDAWTATDRGNLCWLNDGTGTFIGTTQNLGRAHSRGAALVDLDDDGDLDAWVANTSGEPNAVWWNWNQADVTIAKTVAASSIEPGQAVTYTLTYTNTGPELASSVRITDVLPITLTSPAFASAGATITATAGLTYAWTVADLAPDEGGVITVTGILSTGLPAGQWITNSATIDTTAQDTAPENDDAVGFVVANAAPDAESISLVVDEDDLLNDILAADDANGDTLDHGVLQSPTHGTLAIRDALGGTFSYTPTLDYTGQDAWTYCVTDTGGLTDTATVAITVTAINDAPTIESTPITTATVSISYTCEISATDIDAGETLTLTAPVAPAWLAIHDGGDGTATLDGVPGPGDLGENAVTVQVIDSGALTATQSFTLTVGNEAPAFTTSPVTYATVSLAYAYEISADDADVGQVLTITAPTLPGWAALADHGDGTATLDGVPAPDDLGASAVVLQVTDSGEITATQSFTITVGNEAPAFTTSPVTHATVSLAYAYEISTADADVGQALTITAPTLPDWAALADHGDGTATMDGTPGPSDLGENAVVLQVTDSGEMTTTQSFTLTVGNEPPTITSAPVTTATAGVSYTYQVVADDLDAGQALTITAPTVPVWASLTDHGGGTATLGGEAGPGDLGDHAVVIEVADSGEMTATQSFTITVIPIYTTAYVDAALGTDDGYHGLGPGVQAFRTIPYAVQEVTPTGTLYVAAGTYAESVTLDKTLTLQGSSASAIIDGGGSGTALTIDADDVLVVGMTVRNADVGIAVESGSGVVLRFTNLLTHTLWGISNTTPVSVTAIHNWWGTASGPSGGATDPHTGTPAGGSGPAVSSNVRFDPWTGATVEGARSETLSQEDTNLDARAEADVEAEVAVGAGASASLTCAEYGDEPQAGFASDVDKYYDVRLEDPTDVYTLTLRLYFTVAEIEGRDPETLTASFWDGDSWETCSDQEVVLVDPAPTEPDDYAGHIEVTISATSTPALDDLEGTEFGLGASPTLTLLGAPETFCPGWNLTYAAVLTNTLTEAMTGLLVTGTLPANTCCPQCLGDSDAPLAFDEATGTLSWDVGTLVAGDVLTLRYRLHSIGGMAAGASITHTIGYRANELARVGLASRALVADDGLCAPTATPSPTPSTTPRPTETLRPSPTPGETLAPSPTVTATPPLPTPGRDTFLPLVLREAQP